MTVTVVSAAYGGYDQPVAPPEQDVDVDWIMVTDGLVEVPAPWKTIVEPRHHLHPRMAAKVPKCFPYVYAETEHIVWLDASAHILRPDFVSMCVDAVGDGDIAQWIHPQRDCILPEADVSATMAKYGSQPVVDQVAHYMKCGHPRDFGLWATGCMTWRRAPWNQRVGQSWLNEQVLWTYQDQLSWPIVVRWEQVDVRPLAGGLWDCNYLAFRPHASDL